MMKQFFCYLLLSCIPLLANPEISLLPPPPSVTFRPQTPNVNVITGEYCEEACDIIVSGAEPLSYRRFYEHNGYKDPVFGHWRINPETSIFFNENQVSVGDFFGGMLPFKKDKNTLDLSKSKGLTNPSLSGKTHPLNMSFNYNPDYNKRRGEIRSGDGTRRFLAGKEDRYDLSTPFQGVVLEERKPNGNVLCYEYIDINKSVKFETSYWVLRSITAYNAGKTKILNSLHFDYKQQNNKNVEQISLKGSDGREACLVHCIREVKPKEKVREGGRFYTEPRVEDVVLMQAEAPGKPRQNYNYQWDHAKYYFDHPFLYQVTQGAVPLRIAYDLNSKKVSSLAAPLGPNGEMVPIACYEYHKDHTILSDGEGHKTLYRFDSNKRITSIEKEGYIERNVWDDKGNLLCKTIENGSKILRKQTFTYDKNHNVVQERLDDTVISRTYSDDGFNLKLTESDRLGKEVRFTYLPNTNLPASELTYINGNIAKRIFHFYDKEFNSVCIKTIIDDGHSADPYDLKGVCYRKITEVKPKREPPCMGLPEEILEKTIDFSGDEILLKKVHYTYHPSGKIEREDHYGANDKYCYSISNIYDDKERLIASIDPLGHRTTYTYDDNFNPLSMQSPTKLTEVAYDKAGRPIIEKEGDLVWEKKYNRCSWLISEIDPCGFATQYEYNSLGQRVATIHPDGALEKREYDALGNEVKATDANGNIIRKEYNAKSQITAIFYPDGREEHFTYNPWGTLATHIDPAGGKSVYAYDLFDNVTKTEDYSPRGELLKITTATYSPFHKLSETDGEGMTTHYVYDLAGRLIEKQLAEQIVTYRYDPLGNLSSIQEDDVITYYTYDVKGQLIEKRINDCFEESYGYDAAGNQISITTCGGTTITQYNPQNQPINITDPIGNQTHITYSYDTCCTKTTTDSKGIQTIEIHDVRGRLVDLQVKNSKGELIQRQQKYYDAAGNLIRSTQHVFEGAHHKKTLSLDWCYDSCSRMIKQLEADEKETLYLYDKAGRLRTTVKPDGAQVHREYDALGRLFRLHGQGIDYTYTYDRCDQVIQVKDSIQDRVTERSYDFYGNLIYEQLASGITLQSTYDPYGRREKLELPDNSFVSYSYKGPYLHTVSREGYTHTYAKRNYAGRPTKMILPNREAISFTYDQLLRTTSLNSSHYKALYTYDCVGNLAEQSYADILGSETIHYGYDDLQQLTSEDGRTYAYDSVNNRLERDEVSCTVNDLCQITYDGNYHFIYDKNGNLLSDGIRQYQYDLLDRLICVTEGNLCTTYTYDAFNRRISKNNQYYIWDNQREIGMSQEGELRQLRILGEGSGAEIGASVILELNGEMFFPLHDIQGSIVTLISSEGSREACRYSAFGEQAKGEAISPWGFSSKRLDEETGVIYFGRRYYSPSLGKWITCDPQGFEDGPNLYAYIHNNPLTNLDLHGLYSWRQAWTDTKTLASGACEHLWDGFKGVGHATHSMGQWMVADSFAEMGDPSLFYAKAQSSYEGWSSFGSALSERPISTTFETLLPGVMEAWHHPTDLKAWGKASVDVAFVAFAATKLGKAASVGRASEAVGVFKREIEILSNARMGLINSLDSRIIQFEAGLDLDALSNAGRRMDRGGLTKAGRALDKHGDRLYGSFSKATGNINSKNLQGQLHLDNVLTDPSAMIKYRQHKRFGAIVDIKSPELGGARFYADGRMIGFLEP